MPFGNLMKRVFGRGHRVPAIDRLTYAVGDIHGRADLLDQLLDLIEQDRGGAPAEIIFLGDYVDRGPSSRQVIERLLEMTAVSDLSLTFLKGNHEAAMLDFLDNAEAGLAWAQWGGDEALMSYGVKAPLSKTEIEPWSEAQSALKEALPESHLSFLNRLQLYVVRGDYLFVHAGVNPDRPLEEQGETEFLWIRDEFLSSRRQLPYTIVHGHTPEGQPYQDSRRIGCDTGAYMSGRLTAVRLENENVRFIQT